MINSAAIYLINKHINYATHKYIPMQKFKNVYDTGLDERLAIYIARK